MKYLNIRSQVAKGLKRLDITFIVFKEKHIWRIHYYSYLYFRLWLNFIVLWNERINIYQNSKKIWQFIIFNKCNFHFWLLPMLLVPTDRSFLHKYKQSGKNLSFTTLDSLQLFKSTQLGRKVEHIIWTSTGLESIR